MTTQIAAEMLGLPPERIRVELGDTSFPQAAGSGGSYGAASSGSALFDACNKLRAKLAELAGMAEEFDAAGAFEQFFRTLAKFTGFFLRVIAAFIRFCGKIVAGLFAGAWREKHADQRADAKSDQKKTYF